MSDLWGFLLQTLTATMVALFLLILKTLFQDKLSPRWQYGVWAILGLRLLLPAGLGQRQILFPLAERLELGRLLLESNLNSALTDHWTPIYVFSPFPILTRTPPASVTDWLFYGYAAGVVLLGLWFLFRYVHLRVSLSIPASPARVEQVSRVCLQYGLMPPARVVESHRVETAFVCGPIKPVLVLPAGRTVDDKVLLHELLHLRHGDLWLNTLVCVFRCLHWCNPILWLVFDRAGNDGEALCDQRVLERLEGEERRDYGRILLDMADRRYARAPGTSSMANGSRNIAARVKSIARFKQFPRGMSLVSVCMAVVLAVTCLWGTPAAAAELPDSYEANALEKAMASVRANRPTTLAGALDYYARGVAFDNGVYLAAVSAPARQEELYLRMREHRNGSQYDQDYFFLDSDHAHALRNLIPAEGFSLGRELYYILNLEEHGGVHTCWIAFPAQDQNRIRPEGCNDLTLHKVEVTQDPLCGWQVNTLEERKLQYEIGTDVLALLPGYEFVQETEDWHFVSHWTVAHSSGSNAQQWGFGNTLSTHTTLSPNPHAEFEQYQTNHSHRLTLTGAADKVRYAAVSGSRLYEVPEGYIPTPQQPLDLNGGHVSGDRSSTNGSFAFSSRSMEDNTAGGGGGFTGPPEDRAVPKAMELSVWLDDREYGPYLVMAEVVE